MTVQANTGNQNRLIHATSPYLLQHADNPVDWYEWGEEAFAKAKDEDKPIFLSIGYAACHWCHVMEHESFESEDVAAVLNAHFVAVKVDREERPDIDEIYMAFTEARTGGGGWPMSVWLTPDRVPFHAGTYFPKERFVQLLRAINNAWRNARAQVLGEAAAAESFFARWSATPEPADSVPTLAAVDTAAKQLARYFDLRYGGLSGGTNKFPPSMAMDLLLRVYARTGLGDLYDAVEVTLDHMARGGIYDHIGGGICRYSTDREWLVPHFEKMLYDQALVSAIYLDGYQATRKPLYSYIAGDILDYVLGDMQSPEGGFYSSRDADSDGLEGAYYIWTVEEIHELLGEEEGKLFCAYFDVSETGNWFEDGGHAPSGPKNILHISKSPEAFAKLHGLELGDLQHRVALWCQKLRVARARRTPPGLDDKILTGWNGLMIASLAKGARVLDEPRYAEAAARAADFVLENLRKDGRLLRTYRDGRARYTAYLSDYAFLVDGLLNLYEASFDPRWLNEATALTDTAIKLYFDADKGAFFFTAADAEKLLVRSKQPWGAAVPSGNSIQAMNLLRLSIFLDRKDYRTKAESIFRAFAEGMERSPGAYERLFSAVDFYHDRVKEVVIIGDPNSAETAALLRALYDRYLPNKLVAGAADAQPDTDSPLLKGKTRMHGRSTAYVCEKYQCKLPVNTREDLVKQLEGT